MKIEVWAWLFPFGLSLYSGKNTQFDSACADCPGFLVPGAAGARVPPASSRSLRLCSQTSICCIAPWTFTRICCPQLPYHPCNNGTHGTSFCNTSGQTPIFWSHPHAENRREIIWVRESETGEECRQVWAWILGVNFWGSLNPWINKAIKMRYQNLPSKSPEKFAGNFPKIRKAKIKLHPKSGRQDQDLSARWTQWRRDLLASS